MYQEFDFDVCALSYVYMCLLVYVQKKSIRGSSSQTKQMCKAIGINRKTAGCEAT